MKKNHMISKVVMTLILCAFVFVSSNLMAQNSKDLETKKSIMVNNTYVAATGLGYLLKGLDRAQQIDICQKFITDIRFFDDKSGYFYIYDLNGMCIAHASQPTFVGKDISNYKDSKGNFSLLDTIKAVKEKKMFTEGYFENPATKKEEKKIFHAIMIPGTSFLIGTGVYVSE